MQRKRSSIIKVGVVQEDSAGRTIYKFWEFGGPVNWDVPGAVSVPLTGHVADAIPLDAPLLLERDAEGNEYYCGWHTEVLKAIARGALGLT